MRKIYFAVRTKGTGRAQEKTLHHLTVDASEDFKGTPIR